jgi:hypothetical protein
VADADVDADVADLDDAVGVGRHGGVLACDVKIDERVGFAAPEGGVRSTGAGLPADLHASADAGERGVIPEIAHISGGEIPDESVR